MPQLHSPKVTVLMPVYNAERYLGEAIESILGQTFRDIELLAVNDGSTDGSVGIIERYAKEDGRIRLVHNRYEKGIVGALNTGLEMIGSEYIARMDADDVSYPERLQRQVEYLDRHPEISLVGTGVTFFGDGERRFEAFHPSSSLEIAWRFVSRISICHGTLMFRRKVYEVLGGIPSVAAEDFRYLSAAVRRFRCANLPLSLYGYRQSPSSLMHTRLEAVEASNREVYLDNLRHYLGDVGMDGVFYDYQRRNILRFRDLGKVMAANRRIVGGIISSYGTDISPLDSLGLNAVLAWSYVVGICVPFRDRVKGVLRPAYRKIVGVLRTAGLFRK